MADVTRVDDHVSVLLSCYLDGTLAPGELDEVVAVLESSTDAVAEFRRIRESRTMVRLLPLLDVPDHLLPRGHLTEQLSAYLDGELTTIEMPAVTSHLGTCTDCRHELGALDRSRTAVRSLPGLEPPEFLGIHQQRVPDRPHRRRISFAIASAVAAVSIVFVLTPLSNAPDPTSVSIADLQVRHTAVASVPSDATTIQFTNSP